MKKGEIFTVKAIICEYNPFHKGHKIMLDKMNISEKDTVISLMSGNFVQRGEPALFDKYTRAEAAVLQGVDLVLELPYPYSCSCAEYFAKGGVEIFEKLGCVDELWFGSESGNIEYLSCVAHNMLSAEYINAVCENRKDYPDISEAVFKQKMFENLFCEKYPDSPNDILAVEYIKVLLSTKSSIKPCTYKRETDYSATALRKNIISGDYADIPQGLEELYVSAQKYGFKYGERFILSSLRNIQSPEAQNYNEFDITLPFILQNNSRNSQSFDELLKKTVDKNHTAARIKRAIISYLVKCPKFEVHRPPEYTLLLAADKKGINLLSKIRKQTKTEILTKPSLLKEINADCEIRADEIYTLLGEQIEKSGVFLKKTPYIKK